MNSSQPGAVHIESLLAKLDAFMNTMYAIQENFGLTLPTAKHIGTCINYLDLKEMRPQFVRELTNTVMTYVYSPERQARTLKELMAQGRDVAGAWREIYARARNKFRPYSLQGQFSELLLCNLLQHYYRAVPLVRKMSITTNPAVERHGADAIHIASTPPGYRLYLGEAKTYDRKVGGLTQALGNAVTDVMQKYDSHTQELDLYTYEDFVPVELEAIARQYLAGTLPDLEVHLVCIVTYDEKSIATGTCRQTVLDSIMTTLRSTAQSACKATALQKLPEALKPRLNCILFPVQAMDNLIDAFRKELG